jgi:hypothetical protein
MKCCNHNCRQGRDCPMRKPEQSIATSALAFLMAALLALGVTHD